MTCGTGISQSCRLARRRIHQPQKIGIRPREIERNVGNINRVLTKGAQFNPSSLRVDLTARLFPRASIDQAAKVKHAIGYAYLAGCAASLILWVLSLYRPRKDGGLTEILGIRFSRVGGYDPLYASGCQLLEQAFALALRPRVLRSGT